MTPSAPEGRERGAAPPPPLSAAVLSRAYGTLLADSVTAQSCRALQAAGVPVLLLKGPSLAEWLYQDGRFRPYGDTDLLVPLTAEDRALEVLAGLGFVDSKAGVPLADLPVDHARTLVRQAPGRPMAVIDLHTTLPQALDARSRAFEVLSVGAQSMEVGGVEVPVLGLSGRALTVVLHAAHDLSSKPLEDLRRATAQVPLPLWEAAGELARQLGVFPIFVHGLRMDPAGVGIAEQVFGAHDDVRALRLPGPAQSPLSDGVRRLVALPTLRARVGLALREAFPSPRFVRWWWAQQGTQQGARQGAQKGTRQAPLPALYLYRWSYLLVEGRHYVQEMKRSRR